jgi:hypothetical protein
LKNDAMAVVAIFDHSHSANADCVKEHGANAFLPLGSGGKTCEKNTAPIQQMQIAEKSAGYLEK